MNSGSSLPWVKINDFLAEVGAAENVTDFFQRLIQQMENLVPYDLSCVLGVVDSEGNLCESKTFVESKKWFNYFINYYWRILPDVSQEPGVKTKIVDWDRYRYTEYAVDFMYPQSIQYSLGIPLFGTPSGFSGTLAINRSKTSPLFNEEEQRIMEVLQPHLCNLFRFLTLLDQKKAETIEPAEQNLPFEKLTPREREIVVLLCRGFSTHEICALLVISENTAYRHLNNIFAKLNVSSRTELVSLFIPHRPSPLRICL